MGRRCEITECKCQAGCIEPTFLAPPMAARGRTTVGRQLRAVVLLACAALVLWTLLGARPAAPVGSSALTTQPGSGALALEPSGTAKVKVGWVGHVFGERPPSGLSFEEAQPICTENSGNLVWAYSAWKLVDPNATELISLIAPPFSTPVDAVLLPTANMLVQQSKYKDLENYTRILINIISGINPQTAPILLIAIGSQVEFDETPGVPSSIEAAAAMGASRIVLHPEQINFLQRIEASGGMMTARGKFTEEIIAANGLPPPLPLSCPSLFLNHNPQLGAVLQQKWDVVLQQRDPQLRLAVTLPNIPANKEGREKYADVVKFLAERVLKPFCNTAIVFLQTTRDIDTLEIINLEYGVHLRPDRMRYFYDVDSWIAGMQSCCDFVFGFRIHGTVTGLAAEVPGIVIAPDIRVKELAGAMTIPTIDMDKANLDPETFDLFDFIASVPSYGDRFDRHRQEVAQVYAREFERLKVPLHPGIANIARLSEF